MNSDQSKQVKKLPRPPVKMKDFAKSMLAGYRRRKRKMNRNRFSKEILLSGGEKYKILVNLRRVRRKLFPHQLPVTVALPSKAYCSFLFSKPICSVGSGRGGQHRNQEYHPPDAKRKRGRPKRTDSSEIRCVQFFSGVEHFGSFIYDARCFRQLKDGHAARNEHSSLLKSAELKSNIVGNNVECDKPENDAFQMSCVQRNQSEISSLDQVNATGEMQKPLESSRFEGHSGVIVDLGLESQEPCPAVVVSGITEVESSCREEGPRKDEAQSISGSVEEACIETGYGNDDDDASLLQIAAATAHSEAPKVSRRKGKCQRISLGTKTKSKGRIDEDGSVIKKPRMDVQKGMSTIGVPASHSSNGRGQVCKGVYRSHCNSKRCSDTLGQNDWYCLQVNGTGIRLKRDKRKRELEENELQRSAVKMLNQCKPCSVVLVDFLKCLNLATSAAPCSSAPCQLAPNWNGTLSCQYAADRTLRLLPSSLVHDGVVSWSDQAEDHRFGSVPPVTTSLENGNELLHAVEFYSSFDCAAESYCVWSIVDLDGAQNAVSLTIPDVEHDAAATPDVRTDERNVLFRLPKLQKICDFAVHSLKSAATSEPVMRSVHEEHHPILAEDVVSNAFALLSKELGRDCLEMSEREDQEIVPVMEASPTRFSCLHCIYKTSDHSSIREHVYIHTDVIPFTCGHCGSLFGTRSNVSLHSEREHAHDKPYIVEDSTVCVEKHFRIELSAPGKSKNSDHVADMFYTSCEFTDLNIDLMETTVDIKNDKADGKRKNLPAIDAGEPCEASEGKKDFAIEVLPTEDSDIWNLGTDTDGMNLIGFQDAKNQFSSCGSFNQELMTMCEPCSPSGSDLVEVNQKVEQHDRNKRSEYLDVKNVIFVPVDTRSSSHCGSGECSSFDNFNSECREDAMFSERCNTLQNRDDTTRVSKISIDTDTALTSTVSLATTSSFGEISIITCSSASDDNCLSSPILSLSDDGVQKLNKPKPCSKQYCCQYCDYFTSEVSDIETHVFVMHPRQRRLVCPVCDVYFCKFKPTMLAHFSSQHRKVKPVFIYEPSYRLLAADTSLPAMHAGVRTKKKLARVCAGSPPKSKRGKQNIRISKVKSKVLVLDDVVGGREGSGIRDVNADPDPKDWGAVSGQRLEDIAVSCVWSECLDREGHEVRDAGIIIGSEKPVLSQIQNDQEQSCIWFECSMAPFEDCLESNCSGVLTERKSEIVVRIDNSSILEKQVAETVELDRCFLENGDENVREAFIGKEKPSSFVIVSGDEDKLRGAEMLASGETEVTSHIQSKDFEIVEYKNDKETAVDDCCNKNNNNNDNSNSKEFSAVGFVDYLNDREFVMSEVTAQIQSEELQENCCEDGESTNVQKSFCQDFYQNFTSIDSAEKSSLIESGKLITEEAICEQTSTDMDGKQVDYLSPEKKKISDSNGAKFDCDDAMVHGVSCDEKKYSGLDDIENAKECIVGKSSCEMIDLSSIEHTACQGIIEVEKQIQDGTKIIGTGNCHKTEGSLIDRNDFDAKTVEQDESFPSGNVIQEKQCLEEESAGEIQRDVGVRDVDLEAESEFSVQRNVGHSLNDYSGRSASVSESVELRNLSSDVNPNHDNFLKNLGSCSDVQSCDGDRGGCASSIGAMSSCSEGQIISGIHVQDEVIETQPVCLREEPETDEVISCLYSRISDDDTISERNSEGRTDDSISLKILTTDDKRITDKGSASETGEHQNVELDRLKSCDENDLSNGKNLDHLERASDTVFVDDDTVEPTEGCIKGTSKSCSHASRCSSAAVATASIEPESTSSKDGTDQVVHHTGSRREEGAVGGTPPEDCMCLEVSSTSDDSGVILGERGLCDRRLARHSAALVSCEVQEEEEVLDVENCAEEQLERGGDAIGAEDGSKGSTETMCELCSFVSDCGTEMLLHVQDAHHQNSSANLVHDVDFCGKVVEDSIVVVGEPNNNKIDQTQKVYALDAVELKISQPETSNHSHIEIQLPDDDDDDENDVIFMGLEMHHVATDPARAYPVSPANYISDVSHIDNVTATYATSYSITSPLSTKRKAACQLNPISSASHIVPVGVSHRRPRRGVQLSKSGECFASPAESHTASPVDANSVCRHRATDSKQRLLLTNSNPRPSNLGSIAFVTRSISRPIMTSALHLMPAHAVEPSRAISSAYERKTLPSATVTANQGSADVLLDCRMSQRRDVSGRSQHLAVNGLPPLIPISELKVMRQPMPAHSNYREFPLASQYVNHNANLLSREVLWGRAAQSQEKAQARPTLPPPAHSKLQVGSSFMKPNSWTTVNDSGFNQNEGHMDPSCYRYSAPNVPPVNRTVRYSDGGRQRVAFESHRCSGEQFGREPRKETLAKHPHPGAPFGQNTRLPHPTSTYPDGSAAPPGANSCFLCSFQTTDSWSLYHHLQSHVSS